MTIAEVVAWATNHIWEQARAEDIAFWLWRLDLRLWRDVIHPREGGEEIEEPSEYSADGGTTLLLTAPDDELYRVYIEYQLYRMLGEDAKADDAGALYNELYAEWEGAYMRSHRARPVRLRY